MVIDQRTLAQMLAAGDAPGGGQLVAQPQMQTRPGLPIGYGPSRVPVQNTPPAEAQQMPPAGMFAGKNQVPPAPQAPQAPQAQPYTPPELPQEVRPQTQWEIEQAKAGAAAPQGPSGNPWDIAPTYEQFSQAHPQQRNAFSYGRGFAEEPVQLGPGTWRLPYKGPSGQPIEAGPVVVWDARAGKYVAQPQNNIFDMFAPAG